MVNRVPSTAVPATLVNPAGEGASFTNRARSVQSPTPSTTASSSQTTKANQIVIADRILCSRLREGTRLTMRPCRAGRPSVPVR